MVATLIAKATGNGGGVSNGTSIPGTTSTAVADGAETHFNIIEGAGTGLSTITAATNTLNTTGALMYVLHQDTSLVDFGWNSTVHTTQESDWATEFYINLDNVPTGNCNLYRVWSDGAFATSVGILRVGATGQMTLFLGTGNTTVLTPSYKLAADTNYAIGLEVVSATSARLVVFTIAAGFALTNVYDSGVVTHAIVCPRQSDKWGIGSSSTGIVNMAIQLKTGSGPGLFTTPSAPSNAAPTITGPGPVNVTGSTTTLTFQGNDTDGTISSFACVFQSGTAGVTPTVGTGVVTNPGTANASVTFPISGMTVGGQYLFGATDIDDDGAASSTVVATVNVTSTSPAIRPPATTTGYTVVGGGTAAQALAAGSPSTRYLQSAAPAAGSTGSVPFQPAPPSAVPALFSVTGHASDANTPLTRTVRLWQGATLIATRTGTINPLTDTTIGGTTNTSETAAITDRSALRVDWVVS